MEVHERPCIFISSSGRTGTQFLGEKMQQMINQCHSIHEADVLWGSRPSEWLPKIHRFGLGRMTIGKYSSKYSLRALSLARITSRLDDSRAVEYIRGIRSAYLGSIGESVFLEANGQYALLVDLLPQAFPDSRTVHIVRDPRAWVRSWMNMENAFYSARDLRSWLIGGRLKPKHFPADPYREQWSGMDRFERLCWFWQKENELALRLANNRPQVRVMRFEDLFDSPERERYFCGLLAFVTEFPSGYRAGWQYKPALMQQKVNSRSEGGGPVWTQWSPERARSLDRLCGPLMSRLNYGLEPEWRSLLDRP